MACQTWRVKNCALTGVEPSIRPFADGVLFPDFPERVFLHPQVERFGLGPLELRGFFVSFHDHDIRPARSCRRMRWTLFRSTTTISPGSKLSTNALDCVLTSTCACWLTERNSEAITSTAQGSSPSSGSSTTIRDGSFSTGCNSSEIRQIARNVPSES